MNCIIQRFFRRCLYTVCDLLRIPNYNVIIPGFSDGKQKQAKNVNIKYTIIPTLF